MNIFILGSVAYDEISLFKGKFKDAIKRDFINKLSVSFVINEKKRFFGGCAGNVAYSLGLLKTKAYICGLIGNDGNPYQSVIKKWGINTNYLMKGNDHTAMAFITTDSEQNQIAHFAPGVIGEKAAKFNLPKEAKKGDFMLVSPENHDRMIDAVEKAYAIGLKVFFDPGQQIHSFSKSEILKILKMSMAIFVNEYEWELLKSISGLNKKQLTEIVKTIFITKGESGVLLIVNGVEKQISSYKTQKIVEPTGAGDAFRAGVLAALKQNLFLETAVKIGALMGSLCVEHKECQSHKIKQSQARVLKNLGFSL